MENAGRNFAEISAGITEIWPALLITYFDECIIKKNIDIYHRINN